MWLPLLIALLPSPSVASEIDDISTFYQTLAPADAALDERVQRALDEARASTKGCDMRAFGRKVAADLVSMRFYSGAMERFAWEDPGVARLKVKMKNSVYAGTPFAYSIVGLAYGLDPVISLGGVKIGTDKVGHFIDHGHALYKKSLDGETPLQLAGRAIEEEEGAFGFATTGIKSYADMAANLDGYKFWSEVNGGGRAYVACEQGALVSVRKFHFADYATAGWNEGINCNEYNGEQISFPSLDEVQLHLEQLDLPAETCDDAYFAMKESNAGAFAKAVAKNVEALEANFGQRYRCPIDRAACKSIKEIYGERFGNEVRDRILSPDCGGRPKR